MRKALYIQTSRICIIQFLMIQFILLPWKSQFQTTLYLAESEPAIPLYSQPALDQSKDTKLDW